MFMVITVMRREWTCTVRPNETLHSILKRMTDAARAMGEALMSARLLIKGALGKTDAIRIADGKNSTQILKAVGNALVNTCLDAIEDEKQNKTDTMRQVRAHPIERWAAPPPIQFEDASSDPTTADGPDGEKPKPKPPKSTQNNNASDPKVEPEPPVQFKKIMKQINMLHLSLTGIKCGLVCELRWVQSIERNIGSNVPIATHIYQPPHSRKNERSNREFKLVGVHGRARQSLPILQSNISHTKRKNTNLYDN